MLVTAFAEGKAEKPEEKTVEEKANRRMETEGRFLEKRGVEKYRAVV